MTESFILVLSGAAKQYSPALKTFWGNAKVELAPPTTADIPAINKSIGKIVSSASSGAFLNLTVKEATTNAVVVADVAFWFILGEIIARGSLIGYNV